MYLGVEKNRKFRDNFATGPGKGSPRDNRSFSDGIPKHFSQFFSIALKRYKLEIRWKSFEILSIVSLPATLSRKKTLGVRRKKKQVPLVRMSALSKFPIPRRWIFLGLPTPGLESKCF